jgi:hypothetical protein
VKSIKEFSIRRHLSQTAFFFITLLLAGCGGGGGGDVANAPQGILCPPSNPLGPASGSERVLFYKVTCDPTKPVTLRAVDPANPAAPVEFETEFVDGSLQIVTDARWDVGAREIADRAVRYLVYAKRDGKLYKVSAFKKDSLTPVQFSNETGMNALCSAFTLDDFGKVENSLYYYTLPGPDGNCSTSDDNIQKIARIGMSPGESPIAIPNDRAYLIDYETPLVPGAIPGSLIPNRLGTIIDLVDKNSGEMIGWLAVNDGVSTVPPGLDFSVKNVSSGILTTAPFEHGFSEGTIIQLSGSLPGGLEQNKNYFVHVTSPKTFKFYRTLKRIKEDGIEFIGGTVQDKDGHIHPTAEDCAGDTGCEVLIKFTDVSGRMFDTRAECENENQNPADCKENQLSPPHNDVNMVSLTSSGTGKIQRVTSYTDLYRCGINLTDCQLLKQTEFIHICKISGDNQIGSIDAKLVADFVVEATDRFGKPVSGVKVTWNGGDKEEPSCDFLIFGCGPGDEDDLNPAESTTGGDGRTRSRGILRPNKGDTEKNTNIYGAGVDGIGTPVSFTAGTAAQDKPAPLSCKRREDFFIAGVTPLRDAKHGGLFNGKIVVRFDLLHKPDSGNAKPFLANQVKTKGDLYIYDIPSNKLSDAAKYSSKEAFPDGIPFASDFDAAYFADKGTVHRLPFEGSPLPFVDPAPAIGGGDGNQVAQLDLTTNRVAFSQIEKHPDGAITTLKTVGKSGGGIFSSSTLLGPTKDSLLPFMTGGENVYFQTLGAPKDPSNPNTIGIVSRIFFAKEDGSSPKTTDKAIYAGRTETKIFGITGCFNKENANLYTFPICAGGTLVSFDAADPFSNQIAMGTVPDDVMNLFFDGYGVSALGEGDAFKGDPSDPGDSKGVDLFYLRGDQANSLVRVTNSEGVYETFP